MIEIWSDKLHEASDCGELFKENTGGKYETISRNVQVQGEFDEVVWQRLINTYVRTGWWNARDDDREREEECGGIRNDSWKKTVNVLEEAANVVED